MTKTVCPEDAFLCALVSKENGECPTGSAPCYERLLLLELPRPWPAKVLQAPQLYPGVRDTLAALERTGHAPSVLTIEPDPDYSRPSLVRVLLFSRPNAPFAEFERLEYHVPEREVGALLEALLVTGDASAFVPYRLNTPLRDLLVCTHEARDVCCGRFGEAAFQALRETHPRPGVRVWRSSHIGGHKFAPTLIDLPSGRFWGHLEPHAYPGILDGTLDLKDLKRFYRGWSGLGKREQHAERAAFEREGWRWVAAKKSAQVTGSVPEREEVTIELAFTRPDGSTGVYEAAVSASGEVETLASSGSGPRVWVKQYGVTRLERLDTEAPHTLSVLT